MTEVAKALWALRRLCWPSLQDRPGTNWSTWRRSDGLVAAWVTGRHGGPPRAEAIRTRLLQNRPLTTSLTRALTTPRTRPVTAHQTRSPNAKPAGQRPVRPLTRARPEKIQESSGRAGLRRPAKRGSAPPHLGGETGPNRRQGPLVGLPGGAQSRWSTTASVRGGRSSSKRSRTCSRTSSSAAVATGLGLGGRGLIQPRDVTVRAGLPGRIAGQPDQVGAALGDRPRGQHVGRVVDGPDQDLVVPLLPRLEEPLEPVLGGRLERGAGRPATARSPGPPRSRRRLASGPGACSRTNRSALLSTPPLPRTSS